MASTEFPILGDPDTVDEMSISAVTQTELPVWYRTDTPHSRHRHTRDDCHCMPDG